MRSARWLLAPAVALIAFALYLGEGAELTVRACIWQLPLVALGMAALLVCAVSPRLPFCRVRVPGAALLASVAFSVYLSHKLVIHGVIALCQRYSLPLTLQSRRGNGRIMIIYVQNWVSISGSERADQDSPTFCPLLR